jgi:DNA-binding IscR family transcriptional regulator
VRALDGPLAAVRGERPEEIHYGQSAEHLQEVWIATRAALRSVLEKVTLEDVYVGKFESNVVRLIEQPDAWKRR